MAATSKALCLQQIGAYYQKHKRVPSDKDFRANCKSSGLPSHNTLKKYCPEPMDIVLSQACGLQTIEETLQTLIKNRENKRITFIRASDLSALSSWANSDIIARWLCSNDNKIIAGYRLTVYSKIQSGNGSLYKLTAVRPPGAV